MGRGYWTTQRRPFTGVAFAEKGDGQDGGLTPKI